MSPQNYKSPEAYRAPGWGINGFRYNGVLAQALALPNWIAGLAGLVAFTLIFTLRVPAKERMLVEQFG